MGNPQLIVELARCKMFKQTGEAAAVGYCLTGMACNGGGLSGLDWPIVDRVSRLGTMSAIHPKADLRFNPTADQNPVTDSAFIVGTNNTLSIARRHCLVVGWSKEGC